MSDGASPLVVRPVPILVRQRSFSRRSRLAAAALLDAGLGPLMAQAERGSPRGEIGDLAMTSLSGGRRCLCASSPTCRVPACQSAASSVAVSRRKSERSSTGVAPVGSILAAETSSRAMRSTSPSNISGATVWGIRCLKSFQKSLRFRVTGRNLHRRRSGYATIKSLSVPRASGPFVVSPAAQIQR